MGPELDRSHKTRQIISNPLEVHLAQSDEWINEAISQAWRDLGQVSAPTWDFDTEPESLLREYEATFNSRHIDASCLSGLLANIYNPDLSLKPVLIVLPFRAEQDDLILRGGADPETGVLFVSTPAILDLANATKLHQKAVNEVETAHLRCSVRELTLEQAIFEVARRLIRHELGHIHGLPKPDKDKTIEINGPHCILPCTMRAAKTDEEWIFQLYEELTILGGAYLCRDCEQTIHNVLW